MGRHKSELAALAGMRSAQAPMHWHAGTYHARASRHHSALKPLHGCRCFVSTIKKEVTCRQMSIVASVEHLSVAACLADWHSRAGACMQAYRNRLASPGPASRYSASLQRGVWKSSRLKPLVSAARRPVRWRLPLQPASSISRRIWSEDQPEGKPETKACRSAGGVMCLST